MKYYYLDSHSFICKHQHELGRRYCEQNPENFLIFVKNKFVLIDYHCCLNSGDHIEWKRKLVESLIKQSKIFETFELSKSVNLKEELKEFRIRNRSLRKWIYQVHYLYGGNGCNGGKHYCIASKVKYMDAVCDAEEIKNNYVEAREYLINNDKKYLLDELKNLYLENPVWNIDDVEICKTVDHIVESINKLAN